MRDVPTTEEKLDKVTEFFKYFTSSGGRLASLDRYVKVPFLTKAVDERTIPEFKDKRFQGQQGEVRGRQGQQGEVQGRQGEPQGSLFQGLAAPQLQGLAVPLLQGPAAPLPQDQAARQLWQVLEWLGWF